MLNAKLTATGRHSVRLSFLRLTPLFPRHTLLSPCVLSLYRISLSTLPRHTIPYKWRDKKDRPDQTGIRGMKIKKVSESAAPSVTVEKNYK